MAAVLDLGEREDPVALPLRELEDDGQNDKRDIGWRNRELWGIALIPDAKLLTFKTLSVGKTPTFATIAAPLAVRHLRAYLGSLR